MTKIALDVAQLALSIDFSDSIKATKSLKELRQEGEKAPKWMAALARQAKAQA